MLCYLNLIPLFQAISTPQLSTHLVAFYCKPHESNLEQGKYNISVIPSVILFLHFQLMSGILCVSRVASIFMCL